MTLRTLDTETTLVRFGGGISRCRDSICFKTKVQTCQIILPEVIWTRRVGDECPKYSKLVGSELRGATQHSNRWANAVQLVLEGDNKTRLGVWRL